MPEIETLQYTAELDLKPIERGFSTIEKRAERLQARFDKPLKLGVVADDLSFRRAELRLNNLTRNRTIIVTADTSQAERQIAGLQAKLAATTGVPLSISGTTSRSAALPSSYQASVSALPAMLPAALPSSGSGIGAAISGAYIARSVGHHEQQSRSFMRAYRASPQLLDSIHQQNSVSGNFDGLVNTKTKPCVHCGKTNPEEATFCRQCGSDFRSMGQRFLQDTRIGRAAAVTGSVASGVNQVVQGAGKVVVGTAKAGYAVGAGIANAVGNAFEYIRPPATLDDVVDWTKAGAYSINEALFGIHNTLRSGIGNVNVNNVTDPSVLLRQQRQIDRLRRRQAVDRINRRKPGGGSGGGSGGGGDVLAGVIGYMGGSSSIGTGTSGVPLPDVVSMPHVGISPVLDTAQYAEAFLARREAARSQPARIGKVRWKGVGSSPQQLFGHDVMGLPSRDEPDWVMRNSVGAVQAGGVSTIHPWDVRNPNMAAAMAGVGGRPYDDSTGKRSQHNAAAYQVAIEAMQRLGRTSATLNDVFAKLARDVKTKVGDAYDRMTNPTQGPRLRDGSMSRGWLQQKLFGNNTNFGGGFLGGNGGTGWLNTAMTSGPFAGRTIGGVGASIGAGVGAVLAVGHAGREVANGAANAYTAQKELAFSQRQRGADMQGITAESLYEMNKTSAQRVVEAIPGGGFAMRGAEGLLDIANTMLPSSWQFNTTANTQRFLADAQEAERRTAKKKEKKMSQIDSRQQASLMNLGTKAFSEDDIYLRQQYELDAQTAAIDEEMRQRTIEQGQSGGRRFTDEERAAMVSKQHAIQSEGRKRIRYQRAVNTRTSDSAVYMSNLSGIDDREAGLEGIRSKYISRLESDDPSTKANAQREMKAELAAEARQYSFQTSLMASSNRANAIGLNAQAMGVGGWQLEAQREAVRGQLEANEVDRTAALRGVTDTGRIGEINKSFDQRRDSLKLIDKQAIKDFEQSLRSMATSTKAAGQALSGFGLASQITSIKANRDIAIANNQGAAKEITEAARMEIIAATVNDAQRKAVFGIGTKSINQSTGSQKLRNSGNYIRASAKDIIDSVENQISQLNVEMPGEENKKAREDRIAALRANAQERLKGIKQEYKFSMTTENVSAYEIAGGAGGRDRLAMQAWKDIKGLDAQAAAATSQWDSANKPMPTGNKDGSWTNQQASDAVRYLRDIAENVGRAN